MVLQSEKRQQKKSNTSNIRKSRAIIYLVSRRTSGYSLPNKRNYFIFSVSKTSIHSMVKRIPAYKHLTIPYRQKVISKEEWKNQLYLLNNFLNTLYIDLFFKMKKIFHLKFKSNSSQIQNNCIYFFWI